MAAMTRIILLAHGSPDLRSGAAMRRFAERIHICTNMPTDVAFLDHERPTLHDVAKDVDGADVLVVPMLLSNAFHARFDVPKAMERARLTRSLSPIGHPLEILRTLIQVNGPRVIVAAAGSTDAGARLIFQDAVELASLQTQIHAKPAFITGSHLSLQSQLQAMQHEEVTIVPWLFAEGRLLDAIFVLGQEYGASVLDHCLVDEPAFEGHVISRIKAALRSEPYLV